MDNSKKKTSIELSKDGPYLVRDLDNLYDTNGNLLETRKVTALCRCGESSKRPYCDGTHKKIGFTDKKKEGRVTDKRDSYKGKRITIHDNRGICSHAGYCTDNLPLVWRMRKEPWIDPDGAEVENIIEVINKCPSGALSYTIDEVEFKDQDCERAIKMSPHGPYVVQGFAELKNVKRMEGTSEEHFTLCRCGHSKNKPFCDGSHWYAHFRDDNRYRVSQFSVLEDNQPISVEVNGVELVVIRYGDDVSVLYGLCAHQGARMADGSIDGSNIVCSLHGWSYDCKTGKRTNGNKKGELYKFEVWIENDEVLISLDEIREFKEKSKSSDSSGKPSVSRGTNKEEPHNEYIQELANYGLSRVGSHGPMAAMGVPHYQLPSWDDIQILTAQLSKLPLLEDVSVQTELIVGPKAAKPLRLKIPLFVSDMSYGALSLEAKVALAKGAELAGTGICSGEGGMLQEEQQENSRYFFELASAKFGFSFEQLENVQAFHFKGGQAAKTGTGGHLPGKKVTAKIATVRGLKPGEDAISPARFPDWNDLNDYKQFASDVRNHTGGIPIGYKLSAQHIEEDISAALEIGVDYIILDGRGGGTGAAPLIFRDNISVPTIPAIVRARCCLDKNGANHVTLIVTGGLRTPADFVKALALGADGIALSNAAIQAIGCIGARVCNTNNCPTGIATQKEELRKRLKVDEAAQCLERFLKASVHLMCTLARACGHSELNQFTSYDLTTWKQDIAKLTGIQYSGVKEP